MATVLPAAEAIVIDWAKSLASIVALVGTDSSVPNISSSLPTSGGTSMPYLVISSVPGGLEVISAEGAPLELIVLQFDAYARKKPQASSLIQTALAEVREYGITSPAGTFAGARLAGMTKLNGPRPLPERDHEFIRFTADVMVTTKPA